MELACRDEDLGLDELIALSIRLDRLLRERRRLPKQSRLLLNPPPDTMPEPMQIGNTYLSTSERRRRIELGLCLYCGEEGHVLSSCPVRPVRPRDRRSPSDGTTSQDKVGTASHLLTAKPFLVPVTIRSDDVSVVVSALLDSGAAGNFISASLACTLHLPLLQLPNPMSVHALDGRPVGEGTITHTTTPASLTVGVSHHERLAFLVLPSAVHPLILGLPWLQDHNPSISWTERELSPGPRHANPGVCHCPVLPPQ